MRTYYTFSFLIYRFNNQLKTGEEFLPIGQIYKDLLLRALDRRN